MILKIIPNMAEVDFPELMKVYLESNRDNGIAKYKNLEPDQQVLQAEQDFKEYLFHFFREDHGIYFVLEDQNRYLCALRIESYQDGYLIEALETRPGYRRQGYAKELIYSAVQYLRNKECRTLYSHVHKKNLPSLRTHLSCGFQRVKESAAFIDGTVTTNSCTMCYGL